MMVNNELMIYFDMQLQFTLRGIVFCRFLHTLDGHDSEIVSPDSPEQQLSGEKKILKICQGIVELQGFES